MWTFKPLHCIFPECTGCYSQYQSNNNVKYRIRWIGWFFISISVGISIGLIIYYQTSYSPQYQEATTSQWGVCNTTQLHVVTLQTRKVQGFITTHTTGPHISPCTWTNLLIFECAETDFVCILSNTNQVDSQAWPCVLHTFGDQSSIDCAKPPRLSQSDFFSSFASQSVWIWVVVDSIIFCCGIIHLCKSKSETEEDIPLLDNNNTPHV
jgi:hypothetical protein